MDMLSDCTSSTYLCVTMKITGCDTARLKLPMHFTATIYMIDSLLLGQKSHAASFLNHLNNKRNCSEFTSESETITSLAFTDVFVERRNERFTCNDFRKPDSSGLGTSLFSCS